MNMKSSSAVIGLACLASSALFTGCATVVMNDGSTVVIDWDQSVTPKEQAVHIANESCRESGKQGATEVADVSANPALPQWMSTRRVTFRCQ